MKRYVAMIAVANLLAGCAGISVSDQPSSGGIPFYVKKPILKQETTLGVVNYRCR